MIATNPFDVLIVAYILGKHLVVHQPFLVVTSLNSLTHVKSSLKRVIIDEQSNNKGKYDSKVRSIMAGWSLY